MAEHKEYARRTGLSRRRVLAGAAIGAGALGLAACERKEAGREAAENKGKTAREPANLGDLDKAVESAPKVTKDTIAAAEKLMDVSYTDAEREQMLETIEAHLGRVARLRGLTFGNHELPALTFDPRLPGQQAVPPNLQPAGMLMSASSPPALAEDETIAFLTVSELAELIRFGKLTSEHLTRIYLKRIERLNPKLQCFVTVTADLALEQARKADAEIAAGNWRGRLHGIPYGLKDLFDTKGIPTTWGAEPYKDRVSDTDARVVELLREAGAVLLGKTALGAIAYGDIWFGGITRNPWNLEEGSSGSSAGSACALAAGLAGFAIGTETLGSIVSPSNRCGVTGLRPTFGRVPRRGAMVLCPSLDKIGPIGRVVFDTLEVLHALNAHDPDDPASIDAPIGGPFIESMPDQLTVGYDPAWFKDANTAEKAALAAVEFFEAGVGFSKELVPAINVKHISLPDWPYDTLLTILLAEAAAYFEDLTLTNRDDELTWQQPQAWPNSWREARFISAVDLVQADRFRRRVMQMMAEQFELVDVMIAPNYAGNLLTITNFTGHPSLTLRAGFIDTPSRRPATEQLPEGQEDKTTHRVPQGITLVGRLFDELMLCLLGDMLTQRLNVWRERPPL